MKKLDTRKKIYLLLSSYLIILLTPKYKDGHDIEKTTYNQTYSITKDNHFATYNNHNIYIIPNEIYYDIESNDIYILDNRCEKNPNIKIYCSYKIKKLKEIKEILNILIELERQYPTPWNRTIKSMEIEWLAHNLLYEYQIEPDRTANVDLDNSDEEKYQDYLNVINELIKDIKSQTNYLKKEKIK